MNNVIKTILRDLYYHKKIGGVHTPEKKLVKSKIKFLDKKEIKEFEKAYKKITKEELIIRNKKRTKKGYDWHISLNPKKLKEIHNII